MLKLPTRFTLIREGLSLIVWERIRRVTGQGVRYSVMAACGAWLKAGSIKKHW